MPRRRSMTGGGGPFNALFKGPGARGPGTVQCSDTSELREEAEYWANAVGAKRPYARERSGLLANIRRNKIRAKDMGLIVRPQRMSSSAF